MIAALKLILIKMKLSESGKLNEIKGFFKVGRQKEFALMERMLGTKCLWEERVLLFEEGENCLLFVWGEPYKDRLARLHFNLILL